MRTPQPVPQEIADEEGAAPLADWQTPIDVNDPPQWAKHVVDTLTRQNILQRHDTTSIT